PFNGRTLLHQAAIAADWAMVEGLLALGADATAGVHSPLYRLANECGHPGGAAIVPLLIQAGASIDAREGPKKCTALHMAARRGHGEIATALIDAGPTLDIPDSVGPTPLRRALTCRKPAVAALLLSRGAVTTE